MKLSERQREIRRRTERTNGRGGTEKAEASEVEVSSPAAAAAEAITEMRKAPAAGMLDSLSRDTLRERGN